MAAVSRDGKELRELDYKKDTCIGCGICVGVCPTSSLRLGPVLPIARGIVDMDLLNINHNNCVLCGLCSSACPFSAIDLKINGENIKDSKYYPKWDIGTSVDSNECIYCGKCEIYCPRDAIFVNRTLPNKKDLVIGEIRTDPDKCINCSICTEMCPAEAISISTKSNTSSDRYETSSINIDSDKCVYCKVCQKACPEDAIKIICTTCMNQDDIPKVEIKGNVILEDDVCINCGWCDNICPTGAIKTKKPFDGELNFVENEEHFCKGDSCHACQDVCPCNAVTIEDGHSVVNKDVCTLCGACKGVCPQRIIDIKRSTINLENIKSKSWQSILGTLSD
ncbi:MAG: 4Fe-4S binding protein [Methanobrevibacter sp.]|jgi:4Fe-4S ferredoxin|nr:4Fe-4S binding protein [Methanobrevibacter sp.]